jgi:hypothetical protein
MNNKRKKKTLVPSKRMTFGLEHRFTPVILATLVVVTGRIIV